MDYLRGGELYDYLEERGKLSENESRLLFTQIVKAVDYCHKMKVIHRDLKLDNILLAEKG